MLSSPAWANELVTVGVTGTNGKTTTATYTAAALETLGRPVIRITTIGAFLGDQKLEVTEDADGFVRVMDQARAAGARHAVLEVSSKALAGGFAEAWPFRVGVLTSFSHDHLDTHGTPEDYLASKAQLFLSLGAGATAILASGAEADLIAEALPGELHVVRFGAEGHGGKPEVAVRAVVPSWGGTRLQLATSSFGFSGAFEIQAIGAAFAEDATAALIAAVALGAAPDEAGRAIGRAVPPPGRFEVVAREPYVVVDYAHTPDALERTLATARRLTAGAVTVVFGAGGNRDRSKRRPMGAAAGAADRVFLTSDNPRDEDPAAIAREVSSGIETRSSVEVVVELDRGRAIERAVLEARAEDVVLVAGRGHEELQTIAGRSVRLSDREVAVRAHQARKT